MRELKAIVAAAVAGGDARGAFVDEASFCDQVARLEVLPGIFSQVMWLTNLAMLGVLLAAFPPSAALLCMANLVLIQTQMLGSVALIGSTYNTVSCIVLTLAIGLCVDYSLHVLEKSRHAEKEHPGPVAHCIAHALKAIGPEVLNSGVTTLIGIAPLLYASSYAMRLVSLLSLISISYGLLHGLVVLPVLACFFAIATDRLDRCCKWAWRPYDERVGAAPKVQELL